MAGEKRPRPLAIEKAEENRLRILWDDGATTEYDTADLRRACPCASCVDEWNGERTLDPASVPDSVRPVRIEPVGRYAIRIVWDDGHDTGIYSFAYLRGLAEERRKNGGLQDRGL